MMKLMNKKTGKIVKNAYVRETNYFYRGKRTIAVFKRDGNRPPERVSVYYNSLAELNAEWEDAPEEPKKTWFIDTYGSVRNREAMTMVDGWDDKPIFEFGTEEEAKKAVEKLKAWERLKEKGFEFRWIDMQTGQIKYSFFLKNGQKITHNDEDDLLLLFRGEE